MSHNTDVSQGSSESQAARDQDTSDSHRDSAQGQSDGKSTNGAVPFRSPPDFGPSYRVWVPPAAPAIPWEGTFELRAIGQSLNDAIQARISIGNRMGHQKAVMDAGLAEMMIEAAEKAEQTFREMLREAYERHVPGEVRVWAANVPGLASGALFPRIVGITGNPCVAIPYKWAEDGGGLVEDGPPRWRSLRQLWQWAGAGDAAFKPYSDVLGRPVTQADKLRAGKTTQLRPLLFAWSSSLMRSATPVTKEFSAKFGQPVSQIAADSLYWKVFTQAKEEAKAKVHRTTCRNRKRAPWSNGCGTVAHPEWGEPGSPWRPGHQLAHAHRVAQKAMLADFWRVAGGEAMV